MSKIHRPDLSSEVTVEFDPPLIVNGDGSSIWMPKAGLSSAGPHAVTKATLEYLDFLSEEDPAGDGSWSLEVYGPGLCWACYTDRQIERELLSKVRPAFKARGCRILSLGWSEQGLQPSHGWNFDASVEVR